MTTQFVYDVFQHNDYFPMGEREFRIAKKTRHPFAFDTIKEFPRPTLAILLMLPWFFFIQHNYECFFNNADYLEWTVGEFVRISRDPRSPPPDIFVLGSSHAGIGTSREILERRLDAHVGKLSLGAASMWDMLKILKKYRSELSSVRVVVVELSPMTLYKENDPNVIKPRFKFLREWFEIKHPSMEFHWSETLVSMRFSLHDIVKYNRKKPILNDRESNWTNEKYERNKSDYLVQVAEDLAKYRKNMAEGADFHVMPMDRNLFPLVFELLEYCKSRGIYVVFNVYPQEIAQAIPKGRNLTFEEERYLTLLGQLRSSPHCSIILASNFEDILSSPHDYENKKPLTFDNYHMRKEGAILYTNWLVDRMLENHAISSRISTIRHSRVSFPEKQVDSSSK